MTTQIKAGVIAANAVNSSELASGALSGQNFTGDIAFDTTTLKIDSSNNRVGIGTSSPLAPLDVVRGGTTGLSSVNARTALLVQNNLSNGTVLSINAKNTGYSGIFLGDQDNEAICQIQYVHTDDKLKFLTNGGGYNPLTLSGTNVGIGTSSPASALEVNNSSAGDTVATFEGSYGSGGDVQLVRYERGGGAVYGAISYKDATTDMEFGNISSHALSFITANTRRLTINASGNVGIGTASPQMGLHVGSGTQAIAALNGIGIANGSSAYSFFQASDGTKQYIAGVDHSISYTKAGTLSNHDHAIVTNNTNRIYIENTGNVGIGTTSPATGLHVVTAGGTTPFRVQGGANAGVNIMEVGYAGGGAGANFIVDDNGRVGIGTDSPDRQLHVSAAAPAYIRLERNDTTISSTNIYGGIEFEGQDGSAASAAGVRGKILGVAEGATGEMALTFETAGGYGSSTERMRIASSGSVEIGSSTNTGSFKVINTSAQACTFDRRGTDGTVVLIRNDDTNVGSISVSGSSTAYNTSSDARLKDVTGEARGLEVINELNPVAYNWKESGKADEGLIAQEVLDIVPNAVSGSEEEMYQMDYSKLVVHLVKGMKEQQTIIDDLKSRLDKAGL